MRLLIIILDTLRVLAIGNSFSIDALETEFYPVCREAGIELVVGNLYYGGCSLRQHAEFLDSKAPVYSYRTIIDDVRTQTDSVNMLAALDDRRWDIISLQQASHDSGDRTTFEPYLSRLIDSVYAHQPQARLVWHQTWAYQHDAKHPDFPRYQSSQQVMYDSIESCTTFALQILNLKSSFLNLQSPIFNLQSSIPSDRASLKQRILNLQSPILVPSGRAIQRARATSLGDTFCRDGYHLNHLYGRYTAALTWLEALTGYDCRKIRYRATDDNGKKMTKKQRRIISAAVHSTCNP
ncbi:MAG: DUF4886 domain-containing protein [Paludibacteraceae bacterium]|nr:DUF4886 domain-containing protein [Paludibacteraceae bacterium]